MAPDAQWSSGTQPASSSFALQSRDQSSQVIRILEAYLGQLERDGHADPEALLAQHPELADELRPYLAKLDELHQAAGKLRDDSALDAAPAGEAEPINAGRLGDFRILCELGRGGMGVVYEAEQISLLRRVALKVLPFAAVLDERALKRFHNEALAAAQLEHPHIVSVYGVGCERGVHYYAMRLVDGPTLADVIKQLQHTARQAGRGPESLAEFAASRRGDRQRTSSRMDIPVRQVESESQQPSSAQSSSGDEATEDYSPPRRGSHLTPRSAVDALAPVPDSPLTTPHQQAHASTWRSFRSPAFFRSIATFGIQVAEALAHAHALGIVHRDVKPSNLMLDANGNAWVTDFGLAHIEANPSLTAPGDLLGTLRYMSPEQADGSHAGIDHRIDVYALGVTLYELATLRPAFSGESRQELLRQISVEEPPAPRRINGAVPLDLETIIQKAMAKEPARRYASCGSLAEDLRRYLADRPIQARRPGVGDWAVKWSRRNRTVVVVAAVVLLLLSVAGPLVAVKQASLRNEADQQRKTAQRYNKSLVKLVAREREQGAELTRQRDRAKWSEDLARVHQYVGHIRLAQEYRDDGHRKAAVDLLQRGWPAAGETDLRGFEWHYLWGLCRREVFPLRDHAGHVYGLAFSPDGKTLASLGGDEKLRFWNLADDCTVTSQRKLPGTGHEVAWSPDGHTLAFSSSGDDQEYQDLVTLLDIATGKEVATYRVSFDVSALAFSSDSRLLAACGNTTDTGDVLLWDMQMGQRAAWSVPGCHIASVTFLEHDTNLAAASTNGAAYWIWPVESSEGDLHRFGTHYLDCGSSWPEFAPHARTLAGGAAGKVLLWDTAQHRLMAELTPKSTINCKGFSPDGRTLAVGAADALEIWDAASGRMHTAFERPGLDVRTLSFTADGQTIAFGCSTGDIWLWRNWNGQRELPRLAGHPAEAWCVAFSPDGKMLSSGGDDHAIRLWDLASGRAVRSLDAHGSLVTALGWSNDGRTLASSSFDATVKLWDTATWRERLTLRGHEGPVRAVAFAPDDQAVASAGDDGAARLWDAATGELRFTLTGHTKKLHCLAFAPSGKLLATAGDDRSIKLWRTSDGHLARTLSEPDSVLSIAFSPDGSLLASSVKRGLVRLRDTKTGTVLATLRSHEQSVRSLTFSPDGKTLATGGEDRSVKLWNVATGQELLTLAAGETQVNGVAFSRDGQGLAAATHDGAVKVWTTGIADEEGPKFAKWGRGDAEKRAAIEPRTAGLGSWDQQAQLFPARLAPGDEFGNSVAISNDGNTVLIGAYLDDVGSNRDQGSVYILTRSGGIWEPQAQLTAGDGTSGDRFGVSVALSSDGNTALVGAGSRDIGSTGKAYVFTRSDGTWTQNALLTVAGGPRGDLLVRSVALSGDGRTALLGANRPDLDSTTEQALAYVFTCRRGNWEQQAQLTAIVGPDVDYFALALSSDGATALVGALFDDDGPSNDQGSAYVFIRRRGIWVQQARLAAADAAAGDRFGVSVALSGDGGTALVGAHGNDIGSKTNHGSAYVFTRSGDSWMQQGQLIAAGGAAWDRFGVSVALSADGRTALVGAYMAHPGLSMDQGSAYAFTRSGGTWLQQAQLTASTNALGDLFGCSAALSGDGFTALVGARTHDVGSTVDQGSAYVFTFWPAYSAQTNAVEGGTVTSATDESRDVLRESALGK